MLSLPGRWAWDFWLADDGEQHHLFFLHASHELGAEHRRHRAARIGHAVSTDLSDWTLLGDPFDVGPVGAFDDTATWTGSVVRADDGRWFMFYTGSHFVAPEPDYRNVETVGVAVSDDLVTWQKLPGPVTRADGRWYETFGTSSWREEAWRDPWVLRDADGVWHMLTTARANHGPVDDRGVIGHAVSPDLLTWEVRPPLSQPGAGFAHLEVPQLAEIDGHWFLLFSAGPDSVSDALLQHDRHPGTWVLPVSDPAGPFDVEDARPVTSSTDYSGRLVRRRDGSWSLMSFTNSVVPGGAFVGTIADPLAVQVSDGRLLVASRAVDARPA